MKVRFTSTEIRCRISESEASELQNGKTVEVSTVFSPIDIFKIELIPWLPNVCSVATDKKLIRIQVPQSAFTNSSNEIIQYAGVVDNGDKKPLHVLIEVDLPTKH
jgi:hypothetical protein